MPGTLAKNLPTGRAFGPGATSDELLHQLCAASILKNSLVRYRGRSSVVNFTGIGTSYHTYLHHISSCEWTLEKELVNHLIIFLGAIKHAHIGLALI